MDENSEVPFLLLAPAPEYTGIITFTLPIFHNPVAKRARHAAKRHSPGEAGVGRAKLAAGRGTWKIFTA
jgi:hypothetical protein